MKLTHLRIPAAAILALTLCLTTAPTAFAESIHHRDARHDVVSFDNDGGVLHRRHARDPDVISTKLAHLSDRVIIGLTFASLRRDQQDRTTRGPIVTPTTRYKFRSVVNAAEGSATLSLRGNGHAVACPGLRQTVRYATDRLTLRVPGTCLASPRWVQIGVITGLDRPHTSGLWDDGLRDGTNLNFTPKISRKLVRQP